MGWEDRAEQQDVEFGLVVPYQHAWPRVQIFPAGDDVEMDSCSQGHGVLEGAAGGVLGGAMSAH